MSSIIEFKHKYGDTIIVMDSINQIYTSTGYELHDIFIDSIMYSFDTTDELNKVHKEIKNWIKENK